MGLRSLVIILPILAGCRLAPGPYYYLPERTEGQMRAVMDWFKSNHDRSDVPFPDHHLEEDQITTATHRRHFSWHGRPYRISWEGNDSLHSVLAEVDVEGETYAYGIIFTISPPIDSSPEDEIHDWRWIFQNHEVTQYYCWRAPAYGREETIYIHSRTDWRARIQR